MKVQPVSNLFQFYDAPEPKICLSSPMNHSHCFPFRLYHHLHCSATDRRNDRFQRSHFFPHPVFLFQGVLYFTLFAPFFCFSTSWPSKKFYGCELSIHFFWFLQRLLIEQQSKLWNVTKECCRFTFTMSTSYYFIVY